MELKGWERLSERTRPGTFTIHQEPGTTTGPLGQDLDGAITNRTYGIEWVIWYDGVAVLEISMPDQSRLISSVARRQWPSPEYLG